ncbi:MAG TPA: amino acid ABC transporter permease [Acetobacteraceae bacterium]|nr:amino acid ABC transporter permease [Acetobacteraceae bacterium]
MVFNWDYFARQLFLPGGLFMHGLLLTVTVSLVSQLLGSALGLLVALGRISKWPAVRTGCGLYIWLIRGTPLLVQIVFIYTGLAAANLFHFQDIALGPLVIPANVQAGILALSLNEGAYMAEIIRAGIAGVDFGQAEAARALGMPPLLVMRRIVLPQAFRLIIPPVGNQFNIMLKNSTLLSIIGVPELLLVTETINSATFRTFELYSVVGLYFLALTTAWSLVQRAIERRFTAPGRHAVRDRRARRRLLAFTQAQEGGL